MSTPSTHPEPMLALEYSAQRARKIDFPCFTQPKLDGVRMIVHLESGSMTSRKGNDFGHLTYLLLRDLQVLTRLLKDVTIALDGELYVHGVPFQRIVSMVKNRSVADAARGLEYHVYDMIDIEHRMSFGARYAALHRAFSSMIGGGVEGVGGVVKLVPCSLVNNIQNIDTQLALAESHGYEGIMIRHGSTHYECGKRSPSLLKYKRFDTTEYVVVGFKEAKGKDRGTPVFECSIKKNNFKGDDVEKDTFHVRPLGTIDERRMMFASASDMVGKKLTVKHQGVSKDGIPRFPVALVIRDYE